MGAAFAGWGGGADGFEAGDRSSILTEEMVENFAAVEDFSFTAVRLRVWWWRRCWFGMVERKEEEKASIEAAQLYATTMEFLLFLEGEVKTATGL